MKLISADAFIEEMRKRIRELIDLWGKTPTPEIKSRARQMAIIFTDAALTAKTLPTVDAVEVVRCEDCANADTEIYWCRKFSTWITADDFCSYGERRQDGEQKTGEELARG